MNILKVERITAALDKTIVISEVGVNESINLVTKQNTVLLDTKVTDSKIKVNNPENQNIGKE